MIRCELSLDGGDSWRLAEIERQEKPTPYNKYWCWVFWSVAVPGAALPLCRRVLALPACMHKEWMPLPHQLTYCTIMRLQPWTCCGQQRSACARWTRPTT